MAVVYVVYTVSGAYCVLVRIEATGSYTYTINNDLPAVKSLGSSDIVSDEFEVKVGDGTNTSSAQTLTITIQGKNDAPTAPTLSNSNIDENVAGDSVGEIASSDAEGQDVSYTIADGGDGASFEINGSTLKLKSSVTADVETKSIYTVGLLIFFCLNHLQSQISANSLALATPTELEKNILTDSIPQQ